MNIGILSPYLDIFGGGERFLLTIAEYLSKNNHVTLYTDRDIKNKSKEIFEIPLDRVIFIPTNSLYRQNLLKKYFSFRQYDLFFYMTDGSLFFSSSKRNFLIVQSPSHIPHNNLLNQLKLYNWKILCYSKFMKDIIEKKIIREAILLPPGIDAKIFQKGLSNKKKVILTVGRFFKFPHSKKQDVLVEWFIKYYRSNFKGWRLVVAGGLTEGSGDEVVERIKKKARNGYPIELIINPSFLKLVELYKSSSIYWHAAGYDEDLKTHPERAEHFGITTLEAMAGGSVPVVFNAGGQREIVSNGQNGYLWSSEDELVEKTNLLISNSSLLNELSQKAKVYVENFSCNKFYEKLETIINR